MLWLFGILTIGCQSSRYDYDKEKWDRTPVVSAVLVKTENISTGSVSDNIEITGTLESIEQVNIIPETTGTVQNIFVREGDFVKKGQSLAQLINTNTLAALERSEIEMERLEREWNKSKRLQSQGAISNREFEELNTQLQTARSSLGEASAAAKKSTLKSPIDGVVALVNIREGELATSSQLFQIVQPDRLRLVASVPERDLNKIKEQQPVTIYAAYDDQQEVPGSIERIAPVVDTNTGTVRVFINLKEGQTVLRPGQFVKAQVEVDIHENTILAPKEGVVYEDGAPIAYVVIDAPPEPETESDTLDNSSKEQWDKKEEDSKPVVKAKYVAERRVLTVGYSDSQWIEVTEGLSLGEKVITIGNHNLEDSSPIKLEVATPKILKPTDDTDEVEDNTNSEEVE